MATSFSGGGSRREPLTMGKQLVNFITCGCESSAPFFVIYKAGREPLHKKNAIKILWLICQPVYYSINKPLAQAQACQDQEANIEHKHSINNFYSTKRNQRKFELFVDKV